MSRLRYVLRVDGEVEDADLDLVEFVRVNETFDDEVVDALRALTPGSSAVDGGGGAAPFWSVEVDPVRPTARHLFEALDVEAVGPTGLAARFTTAELRAFLRERRIPTSGRKTDLALRLARALKTPDSGPDRRER